MFSCDNLRLIGSNQRPHATRRRTPCAARSAESRRLRISSELFEPLEIGSPLTRSGLTSDGQPSEKRGVRRSNDDEFDSGRSNDENRQEVEEGREREERDEQRVGTGSADWSAEPHGELLPAVLVKHLEISPDPLDRRSEERRVGKE